MQLKKYKFQEIYPYEKAAAKILQHLDAMLGAKPKLYRKTLVRYKTLGMVLLECEFKILRLLEEETLISSCDSEFQELTNENANEWLAQLTDLQAKVNSYSKFVDSQAELNQSKSDRQFLSNAETFKLYDRVITSGADINYGYQEVNECAELIHYWFKMRFGLGNPQFKYQIKQLPSWIQYIIVAYGKACSEGTSDIFVTGFRNWCNSLVDDLNNTWAIPYNVFDIMKKPRGEYFTLHALMIYDLLMSKHYYLLTDANTEIKPDPLFIADKVRTYHPELEDSVKKRIAKRTELLELIHLHAVEVDE